MNSTELRFWRLSKKVSETKKLIERPEVLSFVGANGYSEFVLGIKIHCIDYENKHDLLKLPVNLQKIKQISKLNFNLVKEYELEILAD